MILYHFSQSLENIANQFSSRYIKWSILIWIASKLIHVIFLKNMKLENAHITIIAKIEGEKQSSMQVNYVKKQIVVLSVRIAKKRTIKLKSTIRRTNTRKNTVSTIHRIFRNANMVAFAHLLIAMLISSLNYCIYLKLMQNSICSIIKQFSALLNKMKKVTCEIDACMLIIDKILEENLISIPTSPWHVWIGHLKISLQTTKMAALKAMTVRNAMDGKNLIIIHLFLRLRVACHKLILLAKRLSIVLSITLLQNKGWFPFKFSRRYSKSCLKIQSLCNSSILLCRVLCKIITLSKSKMETITTMIVFLFRPCNNYQDKNRNNQCNCFSSNLSSLILKLSPCDHRITNNNLECQIFLLQEAINIHHTSILISRATISIMNSLKDINSFHLEASYRIQNI